MLQQDQPEDFVIATGKQFKVRDFIIWSCDILGLEIEFKGNGINEIVIVKNKKNNLAPKIKNGDTIIRVDKKYYRPTEVETLLGDPSKAREKLGWKPKISTKEMCEEMMKNDLDNIKNEAQSLSLDGKI